jgi:uncharacterized protein
MRPASTWRASPPVAAAFVVAATLLAAAGAHAKAVPYLRARVNDDAGVLSYGDKNRIETKLYNYEQRTGHQYAVLIVRSLEGDVLEDYANRVFASWRLGDRHRDDGLLMLIAMNEHKMRIEVGYGLEGAIPDVTASRVIRDTMAPRMRSNDVAGAVSDGMDDLMRAGQGESLGPTVPSLFRGRSPSFGAWIVIVIVGFFLLKLPRLVRAPLFAVAGLIVGYAMFHHSFVAAGVGGAVGFFLGIILPRFAGGSSRRHRRGGIWAGSSSWDSSSSSWDNSSSSWGSSSSSSSWDSSSSSSSSSFDFSGGGGSSGGGGASGSW